MTEIRITRGSDIKMYVNGEPLYGVTDFKAVSVDETHEIREFLSSRPFDTFKTGENHELSLSALSLFNSDALDSDGYTLSVVDGDTVYDYEDCRTLRRERRVEADKYVSDVFTLRAQKMTKRRTQDA